MEHQSIVGKPMSSNVFRCPSWMTEGLMYQIFPDRFARSIEYEPPQQNKKYLLRDDWGGVPNHLPDKNGQILNNDFFGGNIKGIIEKLGYLSDLGVTVIYLNPIFEAFSNHRYDTADFKAIDPLLGTSEDFRRLCAHAKDRGIRIILDGVFNHTGSDSIYFNKFGRYPSLGAYQSKDSPYFSWFRFTKHPDEYESWWGINTLPHVNETDLGYMDYILNDEDSVVKHWLSLGASGFRLDVVDELPDEFLDRFREVVKEYDEDAVIIGEVWEDASNKESYGKKRRYLDGNQLDSVMNYPLQKGVVDFLMDRISGMQLDEIITGLWRNYPETVFHGLMNILGTHDTPRILTQLSYDEEESTEKARQRLFAAIIIWAMMPGIPCIYYGDEIGMKGGKDPFNRGCFVPEKGDRDILAHYKKLIFFRKKVNNRERLSNLKFTPGSSDDDFCIFHRVGNRCRLTAALVRGDGRLVLPIELDEGEIIEDFFISGSVKMTNFNTFNLEGYSGVAVLIVKI